MSAGTLKRGNNAISFEDRYLPLAVPSARSAFAFVPAHVVAKLRLHSGAAHDLAPQVAPSVVRLHAGTRGKPAPPSAKLKRSADWAMLPMFRAAC